MAEYCGKRRDEFLVFNKYLSETLGAVGEIRFPYGSAYGWSVTYRKGKKLICDIFAEADAFNVMLRLTNKALESVYSSVDEYAQKCIDAKYPCGEGGWLHYRVNEPCRLEDILRLTALK